MIDNLNECKTAKNEQKVKMKQKYIFIKMWIVPKLR